MINFFQLKKKMSEIFKRFEDEKFIFEHEVPILFDYICAQLNSLYSPNRSYYNMFYNYCVRLTHVINWRKKIHTHQSLNLANIFAMKKKLW